MPGSKLHTSSLSLLFPLYLPILRRTRSKRYGQVPSHTGGQPAEIDARTHSGNPVGRTRHRDSGGSIRRGGNSPTGAAHLARLIGAPPGRTTQPTSHMPYFPPI